MTTVTRSYLTNKLHKATGFSKTDSSDLISSLLNEIKSALKEGEEVKITSFGTFKSRKKKARIGRNPKTKKEAIVSARNVVSFYASNLLKESINRNLQGSDINNDAVAEEKLAVEETS